MSPQERLPGHALATGRLHLHEPQALAIADAETALVEHAGCGLARCLRTRRPHDDPTGGGVDERARPRLIGSDLAFELKGPPAGIQPAIPARQPPGHRRSRQRLGPWIDLAA